MSVRQPDRHSKPVRLALVTVLSACAALLLGQLPASADSPANALNPTSTPTPVTGSATYFAGLGSVGGCGLPQANVDSQDFVALNVFNTPGDNGNYPRPLPASMASKLGMFDNGLNCGRWVRVTLGDICSGTPHGGQNPCTNGSMASDAYNGATLTMLVADSCADTNEWCRNDPHHLDLHQTSLNNFTKNGTPVQGLYPAHWNNRQISWQFVPAPHYTGDIQIGFIQNAQKNWGAIALSHLPNGIHSVQYLANNTWHQATMDGDMGQTYITAPTSAGGTQFQIRVTDASDKPVNNGRVYSFSLPAVCSSSCTAPYTKVNYTTSR